MIRNLVGKQYLISCYIGLGEQGTPWQPDSDNHSILQLNFFTHDLESLLCDTYKDRNNLS